eukprot:365782-Chlamydomonas_euryale.AAC.3
MHTSPHDIHACARECIHPRMTFTRARANAYIPTKKCFTPRGRVGECQLCVSKSKVCTTFQSLGFVRPLRTKALCALQQPVHTQRQNDRRRVFANSHSVKLRLVIWYGGEDVRYPSAVRWL